MLHIGVDAGGMLQSCWTVDADIYVRRQSGDIIRYNDWNFVTHNRPHIGVRSAIDHRSHG
jgi:hypothetical protein